MNIRQYSYETYLPSHYITLKVQKNKTRTNFWGEEVIVGTEWKDEQTYVDSKTITEKRLEWLNPATKEWEPIPEVKEEAKLISRDALKNTGGYIYA